MDPTERNVTDLARVTVTEAGGAPGEAAQVAAEWCLRSRRPAQAVPTMDKVQGVGLDAMATTMGLARPCPPNRDVLARKAMDAVLRNGPGHRAAACRASAQVLARPSMPGIEGGEFVPVSLILFALDVDNGHHGRCLPDAPSAPPRTQAAGEAVRSAGMQCMSKSPCPRPSCAAVARP